MTALVAPFPWFGGKRRVAHLVWERFGPVVNYVEPFFGSGAVLLGRPAPFDGVETINDLDGYVANFWRAIRAAPDETAAFASYPVSENDLHARHVWLVKQADDLRAKLEGDPDYFDPQVAGWWVWGLSAWIGSGFCSGDGPWWVDEDRQLVHLGSAGQGVKRKLVHLGDAGQGVNRQLVHLGNAGQSLAAWFNALALRLSNVRVASGDWSRVCGPSVTHKHGITGVFLDPPYSDDAGMKGDLYRMDSVTVASDVRAWAIEEGKNPKMRIALCGYEGEHDMPAEWTKVSWKAHGGYGNRSEHNENAKRERIWFSPHCLSGKQRSLFDAEVSP